MDTAAGGEPARLWAEFERWHDANPHVWSMFVRFAFDAISAGRARFSARDIIHRIRWYTDVEMRAIDDFKINDHWSPYYARIFRRTYPQYTELFEFRTVEEDAAAEERLAAKMRIAANPPPPATPRPGKVELRTALADLRRIYQHATATKLVPPPTRELIRLGQWLKALLS
jgi:hypothetical protein